MMFGPPDDQSPNSARSMAWGIKRFSNDELRQRFVDMTVPQAKVLGLTLPDPELEFDAVAGHYRYRADRLGRIRARARRRGPCNAQRIAHRVQAHRDGAWVREAVRRGPRCRACAGRGDGGGMSGSTPSESGALSDCQVSARSAGSGELVGGVRA